MASADRPIDPETLSCEGWLCLEAVIFPLELHKAGGLSPPSRAAT